MNAVSRAARAVAHPAHTAGSVAGRTIGLTLGAAKVGVRTTARVVGWAVERAGGPTPQHPTTTYPSTTGAPVSVPRPDAEPDVSAATPGTGSEVDPMLGTRTPPREAPAKKAPAKKAAPAKKVPASQVPLKSAPTPSLPAALESFDEGDDVPEPAAPARKAAAKKAPAKKASAKKAAAKKAAAKKAAATTATTTATTTEAPARKAPSEQAAVLAPALGLSEAEVVDVVEAVEGVEADAGSPHDADNG